MRCIDRSKAVTPALFIFCVMLVCIVLYCAVLYCLGNRSLALNKGPTNCFNENSILLQQLEFHFFILHKGCKIQLDRIEKEARGLYYVSLLSVRSAAVMV